ncbi:MAG: hypothetical protein IK130_09545 [Oscillospiraceae bacterium]|nr:hypothetical protein [Oscillospiraceae bacterium]
MNEYAEIMQHPRYRLQHHRPMPEDSRAAQFSAFAALSGFDEEIDETARLTISRNDPAEDDLAELDAAFQRLLTEAPAHPHVTVSYFQPDARKSGGRYVQFSGQFRHYDAERGQLVFTDGTAIPAQAVCGLKLQ